MMDDEGFDDEVDSLDQNFESASKGDKVSAKFSELLEKFGVLKVLPCPFIRPTFFSDAWKSKDLCHVIGAMHEFNMGIFCFAINCFCVVIYTFVSTFEPAPLNNGLVYKWISFFLSVGWLCAYPMIGLAKYLTLYYGTLDRQMRVVLWVMYIILNVFLSFISFCMVWGGPSSVGIGQAIEFGAGSTKVKGNFFIWAVFILCFLNAANHFIFWITQIGMFVSVVAKFIYEIFVVITERRKGASGDEEEGGQKHRFQMGDEDIVVEEGSI